MQTNPLPALFPAELGISATTAGKKGVLHTIYAKQRLSALQQEISVEMQNGEGVGLEMAIQEKDWLEENFGVGARAVPEFQHPASPTSPRSPVGGRLSEKLKGLKLGTSASQLSTPPAGTSSNHVFGIAAERRQETNPQKLIKNYIHYRQKWVMSLYLLSLPFTALVRQLDPHGSYHRVPLITY